MSTLRSMCWYLLTAQEENHFGMMQTNDEKNNFYKDLVCPAYFLHFFGQGPRSNLLAYHWWQHSVPEVAKKQHKGLTSQAQCENLST